MSIQKQSNLYNSINYSKQRSTIDSFQFIKKLGQGAYSSVYKVKRKQDGQYYALKKVNMKALSYKQKQNSLNQVRILASIRNRNIIEYKEAFFDENNDILFVIMEYADNGDLFTQINRRKKNMEYYQEDQIWSIFLQICSGLKAMHELNVIHRDLKSANVFLNKNGQIKLGDMNVSKVGSLCSTQTGTPYYASPQIWKDIPYDAKSDIWSLGCVLYQLTTLFPPFRGVDLQQLSNKIINDEYNKIKDCYSQNLSLMIAKILQKSPIKRPSSQFIIKNIKKFLPQQFQNHPIIKQLIQDQEIQQMYSRQYDNQNQNKENNLNKSFKDKKLKKQLLKTINFPKNKKKSLLRLNQNKKIQSPYKNNKQSLQKSSIANNNIINNNNTYQKQNNNFHHKIFSLSNLLPQPTYHNTSLNQINNNYNKCNNTHIYSKTTNLNINKDKDINLNQSKQVQIQNQTSKSKQKKKILRISNQKNIINNTKKDYLFIQQDHKINNQKKEDYNNNNKEKSLNRYKNNQKNKNSIDKTKNLIQNKQNKQISLFLPSISIEINGGKNSIIDNSNIDLNYQQIKKRDQNSIVKQNKKNRYSKHFKKLSNSIQKQQQQQQNEYNLKQFKNIHYNNQNHSNIRLLSRKSIRDSKKSLHQLDIILQLQRQRSNKCLRINNSLNYNCQKSKLKSKSKVNLKSNSKSNSKQKQKSKQKQNQKLVLPYIEKKSCHQQSLKLSRII